MRNYNNNNFDDTSRGEKRRRSRSSSRDRDRKHSSASIYRDDQRSSDRSWDQRRDNSRYNNEKHEYRSTEYSNAPSGNYHPNDHVALTPEYSNRNYHENSYEKESQGRERPEPSSKIIIKGLPSHTTEASLSMAIAAYGPQDINLMTSRDTGECRGFAFVDFPSLEYAQYFLTSFAGSAGDPNAQQLIIESRAVSIDYAYEKPIRKEYDGSHHDHKRSVPTRTDWICEKCACQNFARRNECFRCFAPRTETCQITSNIIPGTELDAGVVAAPPSTYLFVRGFGQHVSEDQLMEVFRQFAVVKSSMIIRDRMTGASKGMALIEFHTIEFATYALSQSAALSIDSAPLKVSYAREGVVKAHQMQNIIPPVMPFLPPIASWQHNTTSSTSIQPTIAAASATRAIAMKTKPLWPLVFETNGASYIFQAQSGYFWEPESQYYYCPKSKLYYNTITGCYYTCNDASASQPTFAKFIPTLPIESYESLAAQYNATSNESSITDEALIQAKAMEAVSKKPVIISLGGSTAKAKSKAVSSVTKKVSNDIAKWGSLQSSEHDDDKDDSEDSVFKKPDVPVQPVPTHNNSNIMQTSLEAALLASAGSAPILPTTQSTAKSTSQTKVKAAEAAIAGSTSETKETFICYVCRRQFNSAAVLSRHEQESALHKENLAKAASTTTPTTGDDVDTSTAATYRDRASERRAIHGTSADPVPNKSSTGAGRGSGDRRAPPGIHVSQQSSIPPPTIPTSSFTAEALSSDLSNPGNQLLRKMGWTDGEGLGKDGQGREIPIAVQAGHAGIGGARSNSIGSNDRSIPAVNYDSNSRRESLLQATKARFQQVSEAESSQRK